MRPSRAKLGERHRHANEIEAKQLDALERETQVSVFSITSLVAKIADVEGRYRVCST